MIKVMILLLALAFGGLFFINGPGGEPILSIEDLKPDLTAGEPEPAPAPAKVYKWQDENGVWQFSNQPQDAVVSEASGGELVEYDGNINTMPAVTAQSSSQQSKPSLDIPSGMTTVSGQQAAEMMDTVNNLQESVDERKAEMDRLTGN